MLLRGTLSSHLLGGPFSSPEEVNEHRTDLALPLEKSIFLTMVQALNFKIGSPWSQSQRRR
jgi:hypothetical protein